MTNELVEKIARAMWDHHRKCYPCDPLIRGEYGDPNQEVDFIHARYARSAKAALAAIQEHLNERGLKIVAREPTEEMREKGGRQFWLIMFDAAPDLLNEEKRDE